MRVPGFAVKKADDTRTCPECESDIPKTAHRCRFCTAYVIPEVAAPPTEAMVSPPAVAAPPYMPPPAPPSAPPGTPPGPPRFSR
jgi:ribosomal protein L40E